jgi:hypothetical protein
MGKVPSNRDGFDGLRRGSQSSPATERPAVLPSIDGEAVVLGPDGLSRSEELFRREGARTAILHAFDLIEHDGEDMSPTTTTRLSPKRCLSFGKLVAERRWIAGVAFEHLDCDRTSGGRAQNSEHDLHFVTATASADDQSAQARSSGLDITRTHVIEHQRPVAQILSRQCRRDRSLCRAQPIERGVDFLGVERVDGRSSGRARGPS